MEAGPFCRNTPTLLTFMPVWMPLSRGGVSAQPKSVCSWLRVGGAQPRHAGDDDGEEGDEYGQDDFGGETETEPDDEQRRDRDLRDDLSEQDNRVDRPLHRLGVGDHHRGREADESREHEAQHRLPERHQTGADNLALRRLAADHIHQTGTGLARVMVGLLVPRLQDGRVAAGKPGHAVGATVGVLGVHDIEEVVVGGMPAIDDRLDGPAAAALVSSGCACCACPSAGWVTTSLQSVVPSSGSLTLTEYETVPPKSKI